MSSFEVNVDHENENIVDEDENENVIDEDEPNEKMPNKRARNYSSVVWNFIIFCVELIV